MTMTLVFLLYLFLPIPQILPIRHFLALVWASVKTVTRVGGVVASTRTIASLDSCSPVLGTTPFFGRVWQGKRFPLARPELTHFSRCNTKKNRTFFEWGIIVDRTLVLDRHPFPMQQKHGTERRIVLPQVFLFSCPSLSRSP
ncbi:hypothetical protein QBC35DRAFT_135713 [Podospora australis]|uniref:Secreted protein n=1 Tax=Podospora australis TaxID=1536484 RepID=A0AAN6WJE9_9PEZI|nr:hypothetical protein QBC35DRAFT_135713 [Podospora australis]